MQNKSLPLMTVALLAVAACSPSEDRTMTERGVDTLTVHQPSSAMQAQFAAFRAEVETAATDLRSEVEASREEMTGEDLEIWNDASEWVEEARVELMTGLDRLDRAGADEASAIRDDIASDLAEMEAESARREIRIDTTVDRTAQAIEERLNELEGNLEEISAHRQMTMNQGPADGHADPEAYAMRFPRSDSMGVMHRSEGDADVEALREEIRSIREDVVYLNTTEDQGELADVREGLSDRVAELTEDVKRHWYNARYSFDPTTLRTQASSTP